MRSVRKVLAKALYDTSELAYELTGDSINALPEYFLSVKIAEHLHDHFHSFSFSMEDSIPELAEEIGMHIEDEPFEYRLTGKADLVVRSKKSRKLRHVVELKRSLGIDGIRNDALRLAWICANTPLGHRAEKNYLVVATHKSELFFIKRSQEIQKWINESIGEGIVEIVFEPVDLTFLTSTHRNGRGRSLFGGVWEFKYIA